MARPKLLSRNDHEKYQFGRRLTRDKIDRRHPWLRRAAILAFFVFAGLLLAIVAFRFVSHSITPVTIAEKLSGKVLARNWVQLANISRELPLAVIASEDGSFCKNWGVEWRAVVDAIREGRGIGAGLRGASTITMQIAKNLYLWQRRSYVRKMFEVPLAYVLSALWPKKVLMETYLNIAPWGPGIVGAEAASQYFFHKSAAALTRREAILLAGVLPSPSLRNPTMPTPQMLKVVPVIDKRMQVLASRSACVLP